MADIDATRPSAPPSRRERGVLISNEKKFAVGLTWLTAEQDFNAVLMKQRAEKLEADYYCVRATIASQHGFGFLSMGHKLGMTAAASAAADMLVGDWHGIFTAENGWWYLAVHSDNISPEGDRFFFSEEEAYNHFMEQSGLFNWPRSYAPATWNIDDAVPEIPIDKLLEDLTQAPILRANNLDAVFGGRQRRNFFLFIGAIAIAFLFSAAILPTLVSKAQQARVKVVEPVIVAPAVIKPPPKVTAVQERGFATGTLELPRPSLVIQYCAQGFSAVFKPLPGWQQDTATCTVSAKEVQAQATWKRKVGSLDLVKSYLTKFPKAVVVNYDGNNVITAIHKGGDLSNTVRLSVLKREDLIRILYDRFGGLGTLELTDVVPPAPQPPRGAGARLANEPLPPQNPPYLKLVLNTRTPPDIMATYFDVPGLKLQNISWSLQTKRWAYTGEILFESRQFNEFYGGAAAANANPPQQKK